MGWLSKLFSAPREAKEKPPELVSPSTAFPDYDAHPVALNPAVHNVRSARELIRQSANETAQAYGLPDKWLNFEVVTISNESSAYFQLQVILERWDDRLWAHAYAFELAVRKRIREFDATTAGAVRAVLWRVEPDAGCPFDDLPVDGWGVAPVLIGEPTTSHIAFSATQPMAALFPATGVVAAGLATASSKDESFSYKASASGAFAATQPFAPLSRDETPNTVPMIDESIDWTQLGKVTQPEVATVPMDFENTLPVPSLLRRKAS